MLRDIVSNPTRTVEPVVVTPETDSKSASVKVVAGSARYIGTAPAKLTTHQLTVVAKYI
jgi:hypothetical protein